VTAADKITRARWHAAHCAASSLAAGHHIVSQKLDMPIPQGWAGRRDLAKDVEIINKMRGELAVAILRVLVEPRVDPTAMRGGDGAPEDATP